MLSQAPTVVQSAEKVSFMLSHKSHTQKKNTFKVKFLRFNLAIVSFTWHSGEYPIECVSPHNEWEFPVVCTSISTLHGAAVCVTAQKWITVQTHTHAVTLPVFLCCTTTITTSAASPGSAGSPSVSGPLGSVCSATPSAPPGPPASGSLRTAPPCPSSGSDTCWQTHWSGSTHLEAKQTQTEQTNKQRVDSSE